MAANSPLKSTFQLLDILRLAKMPTSTLPVASADNEGAIVYDNTTNTFKYSDGATWIEPSGGGGGGGISGSGSNGRVTFWTGASSVSSSADLFWDDTTSAFGIKTTTPEAPLHVYSPNPGDYYNNAIFVLKSDTTDPSGIILGTQNTGFAGKEQFFRFSDGANGDDEIRYKARSATDSTFYFMDSPLGGDSSQPKIAIGYDVSNDLSSLPDGSLVTLGWVGVGMMLPQYQLDVAGKGKFSEILGLGLYATVDLPDRDNTGFIAYDTTTNTVKFNDGTVWANIGGITGSGTAGYVAFWDSGSSLTGDITFIWDNVDKQLTINGGAVIGGEISSLVPTNHLMQINATSTITPLMLSGGSGVVEIWQDSTPTKAVALGMAVPGNAISDDLVLSTFDGATWTEYLRIASATGASTFGGIVGLPKIATGSLPVAGVGNEGSIVYDSTTNTVKFSDGAAWADIGGGGGGSVTGSGSAGAIPYWTSSSNISEDPTQFFWDATNNRLGIGTATPTTPLDVVGGNIKVSGINDEASIILQRTETIGGSVNPAFKLGTIVSGGVNLPMIKFTVSDNTYIDKDCFIIESSGTVASVSDGARRSHYEAFLQTGDVDPVFRLNSSPYMTLEMGPGGAKVSTGGLVRVSNVVTVTCDVPHGLTTGSTFHMSNAEANFAAITGSPATVASYVSPTVFTYADVGADATSTIDHYISGTTDIHFKRSGAFTAQLALGGGAKVTWYPDSYVLEPGIDLYVNNTGGTPLIWASAGYNRVGMGVGVPSAKFHVKGTAAAEIVSVIQSTTSPTNSIMEWWDPAGAAVARVWHTGQIESVAGGFKFPDATVQSTAAITGLAAIGSTPSANGASTSGGTLTLQPADGTYGGVLTAVAQTIAGSKTFDAKLILNAVVLGLGQIATGSLPAAASHTGSIVYDSTTSTVKFSDGASWTNIGGGGGGMAIGSAVTGSSNGSILYSNAGNLAQSNSALYWDYTNSRLGIGNSGPTKTLDVTGQGVFSDILGLAQIATASLPAASAGNEGYIVYDSTTNTVKFSDGSAWANISSGGSGVTTMAAVGSSANANGATISGTTLNLEPASASFPGVVTTGTQTIAGKKTFQTSGTGDVTVIESLDTTGTGNGLRVVNNAGSFGHPGISLTKATVHVGSINGYDSVGFGMVNGITVSAPAGKGIGFRIDQTSIASFASNGNLTVDTDVFFVDAVNNRAGVGTITPAVRFEVKQNQNADTAIQVTNTNGSLGGNSTAHSLVRCSDGSKEVTLINWPVAQASGASKMADTGGIYCNKPNGIAFLSTAGDIKFIKDVSGTSTVMGRAIYSSMNFEWDGNTFNVDAANNRVGIGTASPSQALQVVGNVRFSGALMPNNLAGTSGQVLTSAGTGAVPTWTTPAASTSLAAVGSSPNANGATITGTVLNLQPADASFPGVVTTAAQTFAGSKTFNAKPILNAVVLGLGQIATGSLPTASSHTGSIVYDSTTNTVKFSNGSAWANIDTDTDTGVTTMAAVGSSPNANGASISSTTLTLQPADASNPGVVTIGTQTFAGAKTLSSALTVSAASGNVLIVNTNNLVVDATNGRVGINNASPTFTLDVAGTTQLAGATAITGRLTMSGAPTVYSPETGLTALAGGGQSGATPIRYEVSFVTTAAGAGDSVLLPTASFGQRLIIFNLSENAIDVFPKSGVTIDWLSANAAISIPSHGSKEFYGLSSTQWYSR